MSNYTAYVGLDWATEKHDVSVKIGTGPSETQVVKHSAEAVREWVEGLHNRVGGQIAVCLEQSRGPIFNALSEYSYLSLYAVNPATLSLYRKAFTPSGAKDDPVDADLQRELLEKHLDKLRLAEKMDPVTEELKLCTENRRAAVNERTRLVNRVRACLGGYYPQIIEVFSDLTSRVFSAFLLQWPTLEAAQSASETELLAFFHANRSYAKRNKERVARLKSALPLTTNAALIRASSLRARGLAAQLNALHESVSQFDDRIKELLALHPDAKLFASFPMMGDIHRARIISVFGTDRKRFASATAVQVCAGVAPIKDRSGKKEVTRMRQACSHFMRQSFVEWAGATIQACPWAEAYYAKARAKGKSHQVAVRALAFKWIRILYACWKASSSYSEEKYMKNLH